MRGTLMMVLVIGWLTAGPAAAAPVIREAAGGSSAAIQGAVDQFRADLGGVDNGSVPGSQPGGRREIGWDGGGAAAPPTLDPSPMLRFSTRGAVFTTPGHGFEISGAPTPEFGEINPGYPVLFAPFSSPRLFTSLGSNVLDVWFFEPGNTAIAAGSTGFGAVFTNVTAENSTRLEFYTPDGALLYERAVPWAAGDGSLSFLGVSFNAGEIVGRVRIVSGNTALGPDESATRDVVVMDDFIYGEPVSVQGLTVTPSSGRLFRTGAFDLVIGATGLPAAVTAGRVWLDGLDVTPNFLSCMVPGSQTGGATFRCAIPRGLLTPGDHALQVELTLGNQTRVRQAVRWTVLGNTEP